MCNTCFWWPSAWTPQYVRPQASLQSGSLAWSCQAPYAHWPHSGSFVQHYYISGWQCSHIQAKDMHGIFYPGTRMQVGRPSMASGKKHGQSWWRTFQVEISERREKWAAAKRTEFEDLQVPCTQQLPANDSAVWYNGLILHSTCKFHLPVTLCLICLTWSWPEWMGAQNFKRAVPSD